MNAALLMLILGTTVSIQSQEMARQEIGTDRTASQITFDLDADGEDELITVLFNDDNHVQVVVTEPALDDDTFPATSALIKQYSRSATIETVDAHIAGVPLLKVSTSLEACGPYSATWLSYTGGRRGVGELQPALELVGMIDPPVFATFDVEFDRDNRRAIVTWTHEEEEGDIAKDIEIHKSKETHKYELTDAGVFHLMR